MRIAELHERRGFRLLEGAISDPGPGEVQVQVEAVGVCGSDIHYYSEGMIGDIVCVYPTVLGHEPAGRVVKTGSGVSGWAEGDRAVLEPAHYCYHCEFCLSGRHNVCSHLFFLSTPGYPGFFRDLVNLPAANLIPLPANMGYAEGAVVEPLAVALHSLQFVSLKLGETVAVFGAGPIGLLTIAALKLNGAGRIFAIEPVAHRREMALKMGADAAISPSEDAVKQILAGTGRRGVDASIDCAAKDGTLDACMKVTRSAGRVIVTGIPSEARLSFNFHEMRRKEIAMYNVRRSNRESHLALELLKDFPERFGVMLTHRRPLEHVQQAFEIVESYSDGVGKMVITFSR